MSAKTLKHLDIEDTPVFHVGSVVYKMKTYSHGIGQIELWSKNRQQKFTCQIEVSIKVSKGWLKLYWSTDGGERRSFTVDVMRLVYVHPRRPYLVWKYVCTRCNRSNKFLLYYGQGEMFGCAECAGVAQRGRGFFGRTAILRKLKNARTPHRKVVALRAYANYIRTAKLSILENNHHVLMKLSKRDWN